MEKYNKDYVYINLSNSLLSDLLGVYTEVALLHHVVTPGLISLRNSLHFPQRCTMSRAHQQHTSVPISPPSLYTCYFLGGFVKTNLMGMKQYPSVDVIYTFLKSRDIEHLSTGSFGHLCIFFRGMFIQSFCPFLNHVVCFLLMSYRSSLCILVINFSSGILFADCFPFHWLPFHSFDMVL